MTINSVTNEHKIVREELKAKVFCGEATKEETARFLLFYANKEDVELYFSSKERICRR